MGRARQAPGRERARDARRRIWLGVATVVVCALSVSVGVTAQLYPRLPAGQRSYGGPFALVDHDGRRFTEQDLRGSYSLLYFGYTQCADICPAALFNIADALRRMGARADAVQPLFVNLDAERDSLEDLAGYVRHFHPRFVGLTGDEEAVRAAAQAFRVRYYADTGDARGKVIVHSGFTFFLGPDGEVITYFPHAAEPEDMAATMQRVLEEDAVHETSGAAR